MLSRVWTGCGVLVLPVLLAATPAVAQTGAIAGRVLDAASLAPVAGAQVSAVGVDGRTASMSFADQAGRYHLATVPVGTYQVVVHMTGYESRRVDQVQVRAGATTELELSVQPMAFALNPLVVSASRRQERALDAPASVSVVDSRAVAERPATTPTDHVRGSPGVDVITSGVQSTNVVARGFNNIFSGALHTLTDHRIAGIPSLRVNLLHFAPTTNEDIERIEIVLGPGSALYGPNTASGVMHIFSKSPLTEQGTSVSLGGGEQSLFQGSFRTAHMLGDNFGIKLSGQYLRADEWPHIDATEEAERGFCAAPPGLPPTFCRDRLVAAEGISPADAEERVARIGLRDEQIERWGGEVRADWRVTPDATAIFSAGSSTTMNAVELTGLGAGQVKDWRYTYAQGRFNYNRLFAQAYVNTSDAGDTFLLRNGSPIVDRSKLFVSQVQHGLGLGERQNFTYGADFILTMPETEGTIHGRHEDDDRMTEFGAYVQSETRLSSMFDLVLAGRVDTHSHLENAVFSPRAALLFKPDQNHTFRTTFNRAFSTPSAINLFLDLGTPFPSTPDAAILSQLGYSIRVQGTLDGITLMDPALGWQMKSPFTPGGMGGPNALVAPNPVLLWNMAAGVLHGLGAIDDQTLGYLASLPPAELAALGINTRNLGTGAVARLENLQLEDVPQIQESTTQTYEVGYRGMLGERLLVAADVWFERKQNFVTPLMMQTPFLFLHPDELVPYAVPRLTQHFMDRGMPAEQAQQAAVGVVTAMAQLPLGVISSDDIYAQGPQALMTYRNFGDVNLWGTDLAVRALITDRWSVAAAASLVNRDHFFSEGEFITLNAPKRKGSAAVTYRHPDRFSAELRARHTAGFPAASGVYFGAACVPEAPTELQAVDCTDPFTLYDVTLGYQLPVRGASIQATVQNLLDTEYRSFPGVPSIGRLALLRLRYEF